MLKFCSLYSGSSGNSFFVQSDNSKILVDAGVSCKKIVDALASINVDILSIDAILVTHEHTDHTQSIGTISKKYNIPVYANRKTWLAMPAQMKKISENNIFYFMRIGLMQRPPRISCLTHGKHRSWGIGALVPIIFTAPRPSWR